MIAVVFDMDGVIFDTEAICRRAWHACAGKYNIQDVDALHRRKQTAYAKSFS